MENMTVFPSSIKNKQGWFFFSVGEVVCSLYCTGNCRLESSCVIVTGMQRIWRRAWALFSYHMCFSVVELSLLHAGKDSLHSLACGVFLRVSNSENKCPFVTSITKLVAIRFSLRLCFITVMPQKNNSFRWSNTGFF